jgi:hypothetical protein
MTTSDNFPAPRPPSADTACSQPLVRRLLRADVEANRDFRLAMLDVDPTSFTSTAE